MKRQFLTLAGVVALAACLSARAEAAPFTFTFALDPADGAVTGAPGETVGWGFTIENLDEDNWHIIKSDHLLRLPTPPQLATPISSGDSSRPATRGTSPSCTRWASATGTPSGRTASPTRACCAA